MGGEEPVKNGKTSLAKRIFGILGNVVLYLVLALVLFTVVVSITAKKDSDGAATVFGTQLRFVQSGSMEKCDQTDVSAYKIKSIPVKSCVFIEVMPEDEAERSEWLKTVKVGDVLTFKYLYQRQETVTHRVVKLEEKPEGGYIVTLEGDNKADQDTAGQQIIDTEDRTSPNYIIGRVKGQSYVLGLLVYALKSPVGIVCIVIVPCVIMIILQVIRIAGAIGSDKKEKLAEEKKSQADEIEELKRKLAALQQADSSSPQAEKDESESEINRNGGEI